MKTISIYITSLLFLGSSFLSAQNKELIRSIKKEVDRNKNELKIGSLPSPFFIGYNIFEYKVLDVVAVQGELIQSDQTQGKFGFSHLLLGDYTRNTQSHGWPMGSRYEMPVDNDPTGIARTIWLDLHNKYRFENDKWSAKQTFLRERPLSPEEESLPDFEKTLPIQLYQKSKNINTDKEYWENFAKKASGVFTNYPSIDNSHVVIQALDAVKYYYNTDGTETIVPDPFYKVHIHVSAITYDGQEVGDDFYFEYPDFDRMPDLKTIEQKCIEIAEYITEVQKAPAVNEVYRGPVLIEEMALAEMFQQIFFINGVLTANRKSDFPENQGNPNQMMQDRKVISRDLSVTALSGTEKYKGKILDGYYPVDDQGVKPPKELVLIENGVLKNMLTDRTPTLKYPQSNGHGRIHIGQNQVKVLPGNARLSSGQTCSGQELKKKLIKSLEEEGLEYGYIIRRMRQNIPLEIYRIYTNGQEERVRNTAISNLQMRSFDRILGASDKEFFHNTHFFGFFTTYIVPESMLFEEMEIVPNKSQPQMPYIIPRPE